VFYLTQQSDITNEKKKNKFNVTDKGSDNKFIDKLECGPMPNVMVAVQRRKVWLTPTTRMPCSNAAKTPNPLKFVGVPQTNETISAASGPKFTIL